jgi:hypothetical protein
MTGKLPGFAAPVKAGAGVCQSSWMDQAARSPERDNKKGGTRPIKCARSLDFIIKVIKLTINIILRSLCIVSSKSE